MSLFAASDRPELTGPYAVAYQATRKDELIRHHLVGLDLFYLNWSAELIHGMEHDLRRKYDLDQNIYLAFLATQTMVWDWMAFSIQCACYNLVARELRTILESVALFIHIEVHLVGHSLVAKKARWQSLENSHSSHGKAVFRASGLQNWKEHYALYRELCSFTHSSIGTYQTDIEEMAVTGQVLEVAYSQRKFLTIYDLWTRVATVASEAVFHMYDSLGETPECCATDMFDPALLKAQMGERS